MSRGHLLERGLDADDTDLDLARLQQLARGALRRAGAEGVVPTPMDEVRSALQLTPASDLYALGENLPPGLAVRVKKALGKVLGFLAVKERLVYVAPELSVPRGRFILGHELGHHHLPWQQRAYEVDDETSLAPQVRDRFEREANAFSAELLFNGQQFTNAAHDSELSVAIPLALAGGYGVSTHAAVRRYVEHSPRPCALLVVGRHPVFPAGQPGVKVLYSVQSSAFLERFGPVGAQLPSRFLPRADHSWAEAAWQAQHQLTDTPILQGVTAVGDLPTLGYDVCATPFNSFVLLRPHTRLKGRRVRALWTPGEDSAQHSTVD